MKQISAGLKIIITVIALILPLNILTIVSANRMINSAVNEVTTAEQNLIDTDIAGLKTQMDSSSYMLHYFRTEDSDCISLVNGTAPDYELASAQSRLYAKIKAMAGMIDGADGYFYYFPKTGTLTVYADTYISAEQKEGMQNYIEGETSDGRKGGWFLCTMEQTTYCILLTRLNDVSYGAWIDITPIGTGIEEGLGAQNMSLGFYDKDHPAPEAAAGVFTLQAEAHGILACVTVERREIIRKSAVFQRFIFAAALMYLFLIPLLFFQIHRLFLRPIRNVWKAHRELEQGNGDYRIQETANSPEFRYLYHSFNDMADNLKNYRISLYEHEIEKQRMDLRNLQLQIRPHFLLNTFNLIYSLAEHNAAEPIRKIILYLTEYFRYIFRSGKELELFSKELQLIRGYIEMANFRYDGQISFGADVDPEITMARIPPLLIHNFIENSVKYGLSKEHVLHITLEGRYDDGMITFVILDDGKGFTAEKLEENRKILAGEVVPENTGEHCGLYNSMKRLKYFYGDRAEILLESEPGQMTCFTVCIPYNLEEQDETLYCE